MTRSEALLRLLEHGPLRFDELKEITGWKESCCRKVLSGLNKWGKVHRTTAGKSGQYQLGAATPWQGLRGTKLADCVMRSFSSTTKTGGYIARETQ